MLQISPIEFFLRCLPEGFLFVFGSYVFSNKKICGKRLFLSGMLLSIIIYLVRLLPIHFGVHTVILIIILIVITVFINHIETIRAISAALISAIMVYICEAVNVLILVKIFGVNIGQAFTNPVTKDIYGTISLILFLTILLLFRKVNYSLKERFK